MTTQPWAAWYTSHRWRKVRAAHLSTEPLCRMCLTAGDVTKATVVDHIEPHRGDVDRFWSGPFQSLCATHHSRDKQIAEARGRPAKVVRFGPDGWPL